MGPPGQPRQRGDVGDDDGGLGPLDGGYQAVVVVPPVGEHPDPHRRTQRGNAGQRGQARTRQADQGRRARHRHRHHQG